MRPASDYPHLVERLARSLVAAGGKGEKPPAYTAAGNLWAAIEDVQGGAESQLESKQQTTRATLRVRHYPALVPGDRVRDLRTGGPVYDVVTVVRGDGELVCDLETP